MHSRRRYPDSAGFRRFHSSANHWLIWLTGVAGKFVNKSTRPASIAGVIVEKLLMSYKTVFGRSISS